MRRFFGNYSSFHYERWEKPKFLLKSNNILENITHPEIKLGKIIYEYSEEATNKLIEILQSMKKKWPVSNQANSADVKKCMAELTEMYESDDLDIV